MFGKSFSQDDEIYMRTRRIIDAGADWEALEAARGLKERGYPSADFLLGTIYEFGGPDVPIDLERAVAYYRQSAYRLRDDISLVYLARALMKGGLLHYGAAYECLRELERHGITARTHLAWAWYYETSPRPELGLACRHYVRAAMRGRFWGFLGYSRVSRRMGHRARALGCDCLRVALGPFLFFLIGDKVRYSF